MPRNKSLQRLIQEYSIYSLYFAPRGRERLLFLGDQICRRHLNFDDKLIGIIGDAGSGKSSLIKGMFPGLELTNDDDRLETHKIMQVRDLEENFAHATTFHMDMRFQLAFTQMHEIVDFVRSAMEHGRRVVVEHFNLLFPVLQTPADIMVGIGEEIIVVRPTVFGPSPQNIYDVVHESLHYRKMAHTVEDITIGLLLHEFGIDHSLFYSSDIKYGFLLRFTEHVDIDFDKLAEEINTIIERALPVCYMDEGHISIGAYVTSCSGPRLHISNTADVTDFRLIKQFIRDDKTDTWCLVGVFGQNEEDACQLNNFQFCHSDLLLNPR
jgi:tRNA A37 threonylcarbamoyladenosine biosynthesis protein TsaE